MKPKLRIGILSNTHATPLWFYDVIAEIQESDYASVEVLVLKPKPEGQPLKKNLFQKLWSIRERLLYGLFYKIDAKISRIKNHPFAPKSFENILGKARVIHAGIHETRFRTRFNDSTLEALRELNLDVLINRGFSILSGEILTVAKYGVWSYHHGDNDFNRGTPAVFWETVYRWKTIGTILQKLTEELDNGIVLEKTIGGNKSFFFSKNLHSTYWKSSRMLIRALKKLQIQGEDYLSEKESDTALKFYNHRLYKHPSNWEIIKHVPGVYLKLIWHLLNNPFKKETWRIAVKYRKNTIDTSLWRYKTLDLSKLSVADPFVYHKDDVFYIFYEEFDAKLRSGVISCCGINKKHQIVVEPRVVIQEDFHLSYPCIFEEEDKIYLLPETSDNQSIRIYEAVDFPNKFTLKCEILKGETCFDPTLFKHDNKYWIFCNAKEIDKISSYDELFLFYSESLEGPWNPHAMNPIVSDVRNARPAGNLFYQDGKLYRPAQDCSTRYGYAVNFNEVLELSENNYQERRVSSILPHWNKKVKGVHTFNHDNGMSVIDFVE